MHRLIASGPDRAAVLRTLCSTLLTLFAWSGCETTTDPAAADTSAQADSGCAAGEMGCQCFANDTCLDGICSAGQCVACEAGAAGCPCFGNGTCAHGLACTDGACTACAAGTMGCPCLDDGSCGDGLSCENDLCVEPACPAGTEGCPCDGDVCAGGLVCEAGTCGEEVCEAGSLACACFANATCAAGLECTGGVCATPACPPGNVGCPCMADNGCGNGLACTGVGSAATCELPEECLAGTLSCPCGPGGACEAGLFCDADLCAPLDCTPGEAGCICDSGACSGQGVLCDAGWCIQAPCPAGTEGCPCGAASACGINSRGEVMACTGGQCVAASCLPGQAGCPCSFGAECDDGLQCHSGFCQPVGCAPGQKSCACAGGACLSALTCRDGAVCVENDGYLGAPCLLGGACHTGMKCTGNLCALCDLGELGCACDQGACDGGLLCHQGHCADPATLDLPPDDKLCYTPCSEPLVLDTGELLDCPPDGLMAGCVGGLVCNQGSCTLPGAEPDACTSALDCPDFQTCISGGCYSNCVSDADCDGGWLCQRKVCRQPCSIGGESCPNGYSCSVGDSVTGYCDLVAAPAATAQDAVYSGYELSGFTLSFSNVNTVSTLIITNHSPTAESFVVRKLDHVLTDDQGALTTASDPNDGVDCVAAIDCPLYWLSIGPAGQAAQQQSVSLLVEGNGGTATIEVGNAAASPAVRWDGRLEVLHPIFGERRITMSYSEKPEGRWHGRAYYFATFGDRDLDTWIQSKDPEVAKIVGNALIRRWSAFRQGDMSVDELQAVLQATRNESWRWSNVVSDCPVSPAGACYPYDINALGLVTYSSDTASNPIPTGVVEFPIAMNLRQPDAQGAPGLLSGRIESTLALQYAGDPAIALDFGSDPAACESTSQGGCVVFLDAMEAQIFVGGRYHTGSDDAGCGLADSGFALSERPWLVDGFAAGTEEHPPGSGIRYFYECRDALLPFEGTGDGPLPDALVTANQNLALSNPIPDGRTRRRTLTLVDGALINQQQLFIIFKETFESFLPGDSSPFSAYGYMLLQREAVDLDTDTDDDGNGTPDVYDGTAPTDDRPSPEGVLETVCEPSVVQDALGPTHTALTDQNAAELVLTLLTGRQPASAESLIGEASDERVHYLCGSNGLFDGGPGAATDIWTDVPDDNTCGLAQGKNNKFKNNGYCDDGGASAHTSICPLGTDLGDCGPRMGADGDLREACPAGSSVTFFTLPASWTQADVANLDCQLDGSCAELLVQWSLDGTVVQVDPAWRCADSNQVFCEDDRYDLRSGKYFYSVEDPAAVMPPLDSEIQLAFRYRTQFVARDGDSPGFTPQLCDGDTKALPYCYDAEKIEQLEGRIDCLLHAWRQHYPALQAVPAPAAGAAEALDRFLCANFAYHEACVETASTEVHDGFERFYSELMVMLGDEAYTQSFASRFDLVGQNPLSFEGSLFEHNGVDLSGAAGYEMYSLYRATQYYDRALARFYRLSPSIWQAMGYGFSQRNFVTLSTITRYFERLIRASTQKSRAWSEIAKRYQGLARPDLARRVIARAYTATYVESVVLARLMLELVETLSPEERPQVQVALERGQRRYRMAMADMQNVYSDITDEIRYFGLAPDYVPFPAPPPFGTNDSAVEVMLERAQQKADVARIREDVAIERSKAFETDEAEFHSELIRLRNTYEAQLGDLCGTFAGPDGKIYPAIRRYAQLEADLAQWGDPCGMAGNGQIVEAMGAFELAQLDMQRIRLAYDATLQEIAIEKSRVEAQCNLIFENADYVFEKQGQINTLQTVMSSGRVAIQAMDRLMGMAGTMAQLSKCMVSVTGSDCPSGVVAALTYGGAAAGLNAAALATEAGIVAAESRVLSLQASVARWETEQQCDAALIDANARMASMALRLAEQEVEALRAQYQVRLALGEIQQQVNNASRLEDELAEAQELAVNVYASRNDPNVRIYRDDAIVNAEVAFYDAMREAYRATRVYEFYTSQSYAKLEQLFLIRLVQYGDYNLQNYLTELRNAFYDFEDVYGVPDIRVARLSLRDDLLRLPRLKEDGTAYDTNERIAMMREKLKDPTLLDENGYLTIPFRTTLDELSPLTRVHKIDYIEAELIGAGLGDTVARLYLRARGTGVVHALDGDKQFYRFPERVAVINPFINAAKPFDPSVYRTHRLRDRPLVNTAWELVINQRDELVNKDVDLQGLTDLRLYVYYRDFTEL